MQWNPEERIPDGPLTKIERKAVRAVLRWFDQREYIRSGMKSWALWLVGVPTAMVAIWQIWQLFMVHLK
jgi:hypothetical protein